jgi:hypothetical protein
MYTITPVGASLSFVKRVVRRFKTSPIKRILKNKSTILKIRKC